MNYYYAGLDLGQAQDYTALAIARRIVPPEDRALYHIVHLERLALGMAYPLQVAHIKSVLERPQLAGMVTLALDHTGVGRPVLDMFTAARMPCPLYGVSIHGGDKVTTEDGDPHALRVPKRDLVSTVQVLLQSERLKILETLPEARRLVAELLNFRGKIDPATAHDSYAAWRESIHDDLVLAVALACWIGEHRGSTSIGYKSVSKRTYGGSNRGAY